MFIIGATVGSFLNVCGRSFAVREEHPLARLALRPLLPTDPQPDNLPIIGYWLLRADAVVRPTVLHELFWRRAVHRLPFAGLFYLEIGRNILELPFLRDRQWEIQFGLMPWKAWAVFFWHATLLSFLITTSLCDLQHLEVPLNITVCGTVVGLIGATFFAWPFPDTVPFRPAALGPPVLAGLYAWPVVLPSQLPSWLPAGSWQLGLATGLAGVLVGMMTLRGVRFLFGLGRGKEGLGIGDADVMMMAGAFWLAADLARLFYRRLCRAVFRRGSAAPQGRSDLGLRARAGHWRDG